MLSNRLFVDISNTSTQAVYFANSFTSTSNYVTGSSTQNTNSSKVSFERIGDSQVSDYNTIRHKTQVIILLIQAAYLNK